jgi:hypothetical protein
MATITTIVLTFALVAITAYYAWQTQNMVREMRDSRELSVLPKVTVDLSWLGPVNPVPAIINVGQGPALNADLNVTFEPIDPDADSAVTRHWRWNVIAPGERIRLFPPERAPGQLMGADELVARYASIRVSGIIYDSLGKRREVDHSLQDLKQWSDLLGDAQIVADKTPAEEIANEIKALTKEVKNVRSEMQKRRP